MNKFEQLLDYIVNEEKEKAEELFHEIVVEKSRDIYEQLIAEETQEEAVEEDSVEEETDESVDEDTDESVEEEVEEAFGMDEAGSDDLGGDAADGVVTGIEADKPTDDVMGDDGEEGEEGSDAPATQADVQDLEDALDELKAEFERLMSEVDKDGDGDHDMDDHEADDEEGDEEEGDEEGEEPSENPFAKESRQMTREYREKVAKPSNTEQGDGTPGPINANPKDRPNSHATAKNIAQGGQGGEGIKGGEGLVGKSKGEFTKGSTHNVNGVQSGVKTLSKVAKPAMTGGDQNTKSVVDKQQ